MVKITKNHWFLFIFRHTLSATFKAESVEDILLYSYSMLGIFHSKPIDKPISPSSLCKINEKKKSSKN